MSKILVIGATGYVGGRLIPKLLEHNHQVTCLVRDIRKATARKWASGVKLVEGDVLKPETLADAFRGQEIVYYLVHSMTSGGGSFQDLDRKAAENAGQVASAENIRRIIYLGGLGRRQSGQSAHLSSRHEVGDILRESGVPVTEFRAAVIVGSGSLSFEIIHHLVNRLPVMICPRWVYTRTQPISIADVLRFLTEAVQKEESSGKTIDIGGPEVLTYKDMMIEVGNVLGLKRFMISVPVLTPRLSSYWVNLVTPIPASLARPLIEGLKHETVRENDLAEKIFGFETIDFRQAAERALVKTKAHQVETAWIDADSNTRLTEIDSTHIMTDKREVEVSAPAEILFHTVSSLGGENGWMYADRLWKLRGFIDKQMGGVGLRRGRRHPVMIDVGDALDFWRVEEYEPGKQLLLRAEMKVWGQAWLEFKVDPLGPNKAKLVQTARYYPRGLFGHLYWFSLLPIHALVFRGMAKALADKAEKIHTQHRSRGALSYEDRQ
ncbi:MAG: DUF2867 domain-containing protein [candidate division Zixibacteria bacterium]|nr:DUF2867 domain-containing protein [candidate division Zixibacteria bacterium]